VDLGCGILWVPIITDVGVPGMFARHEDTAARRTDCLPRIVLGKLDAFFGDLVDMRSFDPFLPIATELSISQIIGENENNIRLLNRSADRCGDAK